MEEAPKIGVLLLQLGTPDAPTTPALRRYLREFLLDRRVVDLPRWQWWPVLYGIVLVRRPARSARLYQKVWTAEGSPLAVTSRRQADALEQALTAAGRPVRVAVAMRYGNPSIASAVDALLEAGCDRLVALPMYPQYSSATTGSSLERLLERLAGRRVVVPLRVVPPYFADPGYVAALARSIREDWGNWAPDHLVVSFHGLPKRYAQAGDPYPAHCHATTDALAAALDWPRERLTLSFQSRFGREPWLEPYTDETIRRLGRDGRSVAVVCPGFTADCLETLEEIALTGREQFEQAGGRDYRVVPCLNESPYWIEALAALLRRELEGWG